LFLKYDGELRGSARSKASRNTLRKHFHEQLKTFWTNTSFTLNNLHVIDFVLKRDGFSRL
jgi:hypothetical protein